MTHSNEKIPTEEKKMKKLMILTLLVTGLVVSSTQAYAANRFGSVRVGGFNSHGLGSTYVGGWNR